MPWAPNHWGAPKSRNNVASFFFNAVQTVGYSQNILGSTMDAPNLFLAPGAI